MAGDLITLDGYSGRAEGVRFDLVSPGLAKIGELAPSEESTVTIENNINRAVKRSLTGLHLSPADAAQVDPFRDRVRPMWLIHNPESGQTDEYPMGVFGYANLSRLRLRYHLDSGTEATGNMGDMLMAFDQALDRSLTWQAGTLIADILARLAADAGVYVTSIEATDKRLGSPIAYVAGRDTRLKVLNEVAGLAGFASPWFDNAGVLVARTIPEVGGAPPDFDYDSPPRIYEGTTVISDDTLDAPNFYVVVDTAAVDAPITGSYAVPASAPHSISNRGYPVVRLIEVQGLQSTAAARDLARASALQDRSAFQWAEVQSVVNPLHDTFNVVQFDRELWREQAWRVACAPGGPQMHSWRRTYREGGF
jgi:hypothetical protein